MAYWIRDESLEWVESAETESGHYTDAVWASGLLSDDLLRWSRWWAGLGAFVAALLTSTIAGSILMLALVNPPGDAVSIVLVVVAVAVSGVLTAGCCVVLWRLHRSGRRLAMAMRWWLRMRADVVPGQGFAGWLGPRAALFNPAVFVRVVTAVLSAFVGLFGFSSIGMSFVGDSTLLVAAIVWALLGTACCIGQMGGVMRLVNGLADADPLWNRIRGR